MAALAIPMAALTVASSPDEIILAICAYLAASDLLRVAEANTRWREQADAEDLWETHCLSSWRRKEVGGWLHERKTLWQAIHSMGARALRIELRKRDIPTTNCVEKKACWGAGPHATLAPATRKEKARRT